MAKSLFEVLESKEQRMIEIRRYLHQHPELSFHEEQTAKYIEDFYKDKAVKITKNVGPRGIKIEIDSGRPGKHLRFVPISMHYLFKKRQMFLFVPKWKGLCMPVAMMPIPLIC